jgi:hypothetical protein
MSEKTRGEGDLLSAASLLAGVRFGATQEMRREAKRWLKRVT